MQNCTINLKEIVDSTKGVFSHLLELGDVKILLNCGTSDDLCVESYKDLCVETIDFILLSHSGISFVGALPSLLRRPFGGKIYATTPVKNLGKLILVEKCRHLKVFRHEKKYSEEEVGKAFETINGIKYLQPIDICEKISVMAYNSGHTLGGTVWKISSDTRSIIFCMRFDHRKINHLNGIDMSSLAKNSLCIFDTGYINQKVVNRKDRNRYFKEIVEKRLGDNGKILIIIGYEGFLEIALVLDEILRNYKLPQQNSVGARRASCIGFSAKKYSEIIKSMVEWAGDNVFKDFLEPKENPFSFSHLDFFYNYSDLEMSSSIFITFEDFGYASKILEMISKESKSLVLNFLTKNVWKGMTVEDIPNFYLQENTSAEEKEEEVACDVKKKTGPDKKEWYEKYTDVWADTDDVFFPSVEENKPFDDYNELFVHTGLVKENEGYEKEVSSTIKKERAYERVEVVESSFKVSCEVEELFFGHNF